MDLPAPICADLRRGPFLPHRSAEGERHDGRGELDVVGALVAAEPRRGEGEERAQALAAGGDDMAGELRDELHIALHVLDDQLVDAGEIRADQVGQTVQRILLCFFAPGFEVHNDGHAGYPYLNS